MAIIIPSPRNGKKPKIHPTVFVAPTAVIIGDVIVEENANIWFGAVIRGDWGQIKIGKRTSIQENVTIHVEQDEILTIGDDCIIGHHAMVHGPSDIKKGCLIGIGSNILPNSKLGEGCLIGAGAVLVNKKLKPRSIALGIPAEVVKELPEEKMLIGEKTSFTYAKNGEYFRNYFQKNSE